MEVGKGHWKFWEEIEIGKMWFGEEYQVLGTIYTPVFFFKYRLIETKMCWGVIFLLGGGFALAKVNLIN